MKLSLRTLSVLIAGVAACSDAVAPAGPQLELLVHLDKDVYFEDEPIHIVFEVVNTEPDTVWLTAPFETDGWIRTNVEVSTGQPLYFVGTHVFRIFGPAWKGEPLAPDSSLFFVSTLQHLWTDSTGKSVHRLPMGHLPVGRYALDTRYYYELGSPEPAVDAETRRFAVRSRLGSERDRHSRLQAVVGMAWDSTRRSELVSSLLGYAATELFVDSTAPLVPIAVSDAFSLASGIGQNPSDEQLTQLSDVRQAVIGVHHSGAAGARVTSTLYMWRDQLQEVSSRWPGTLVSRYAHFLMWRYSRIHDAT